MRQDADINRTALAADDDGHEDANRVDNGKRAELFEALISLLSVRFHHAFMPDHFIVDQRETNEHEEEEEERTRENVPHWILERAVGHPHRHDRPRDVDKHAGENRALPTLRWVGGIPETGITGLGSLHFAAAAKDAIGS